MENKFPIGIFPPTFRKIIEEASLSHQYPLDYLAAAVLWVVSVLVGACARLRTAVGVTYANIYLMLVGVQGAHKTAPLAWATEYLHQLDDHALNQYEQELQEYQEALACGNKTHRPVAKRFLVDGSTPEAILKRVRENPKGTGQCSDEIARAFKDLGRYSRRGGDDELYLRLYNGYTITIDRATQDEVLHVSRPYFCLAGTIQPATFNRVFTRERVESGLLARFIEVVHFEEEPLLWNLKEDLPGDEESEYIELLDRLIYWREHIDLEHPVEFQLDEAAAETLQAWQNEHEIQIADHGREIDRAVFRKIQVYVLKFALLIQVMKSVEEGSLDSMNKIGFDTATFAILLADYFFRNAKDLARSVYVRMLNAREQAVYDALPREFNSEEGLKVAKQKGLGKTCYYDLISKCLGILLDKRSRAHYVKRN